MNRIKQLREKTGLSQAEFSKEYGMSARTLTAWENDKRVPQDWVIDLLERVIQDENIPRYSVEHDVSDFYYNNFGIGSYFEICGLQETGYTMSQLRKVYKSNNEGLSFEAWFNKYFAI